jgi:hypothetical protein
MSYFSNKKGSVAGTAGAPSKPISRVSEDWGGGQMNRRLFMRTVSVGVAALALNACGGGAYAGGDVAPTAESTPGSGSSTEPSWATLPTITFTEGVAGSISIAAYVADDHALSITKNAASLPAGVTYDAATKSFVYDGIGAASYTDGHVLTAMEA